MSWYKYTFPLLAATLTGKERYKPEIKWSYLWTANLFRSWEMVFWRRVGIRPEVSSYEDEHIAYQEFYTWESLFVFLECGVRSWFTSKKPRLAIKRVYLPQLAFAGLPNPYQARSAYVFAVAFVNESLQDSGAADPQTLSHTVSGSDTLLFCYINLGSTSADSVSSVNYNGDAATRLTGGYQVAGTTSQYVYALINPDAGTNTITYDLTSSLGGVKRGLTYSGVKQTDFPDATGAVPEETGTTLTKTISASADGAWAFAMGKNTVEDFAAGANTTLRDNEYLAVAPCDSNGTAVAGGNLTLTLTHPTSSSQNLIGCTFLAAGAAGGAARVPPLFMLLGVGN